MPNKWTGDVVGMMHVHKITNQQLAAQLGVTDRYVSMVLNGHRSPEGAKDRFMSAVREIIGGGRT